MSWCGGDGMTARPLEFQAKWDYVESHGLHTVTPRPGYVVTLEDSAGRVWSGDSLQGAIEAHALNPAAVAPCAHYRELGELQGMTVSGHTAPCPHCGVEVTYW